MGKPMANTYERYEGQRVAVTFRIIRGKKETDVAKGELECLGELRVKVGPDILDVDDVVWIRPLKSAGAASA